MRCRLVARLFLLPVLLLIAAQIQPLPDIESDSQGKDETCFDQAEIFLKQCAPLSATVPVVGPASLRGFAIADAA